MLKLVDKETGQVLISFHEHKAQIHNPLLATEMENLGILIPPAFQKNFDGKKVIFPGDELFQKAFVEIYYRIEMANPAYQWET